MPSEWYDSGCGGARVRWTDEGFLEIEGEGAPDRPLKDAVFAYQDKIIANAADFDLPPHFIAGIIGLESGGNATIVSPAGALGLMQLMPKTARGVAKDDSLTTEDILDVDTNLHLGCKLLRQLWDLYDGNPIKVPFAYNAGKPRCGVGIHRGQYGSGEPCAPNRWGLVADCWGKEAVTVDYAGIVFGLANNALSRGFPSDASGYVSPGNVKSASWAKKLAWVAIGGAAIGLFALTVTKAGLVKV